MVIKFVYCTKPILDALLSSNILVSGERWRSGEEGDKSRVENGNREVRSVVYGTFTEK